ncbi:hypothetical protein M569_03076 [Genlisea aurea]|uniref:BAG domain-containing protein n=1 Tax=Genlisea aurea TaxID=192259 RepID=S8CW91_9LAMI|nr:hypothetical protein M569_03076 [Genlisea aurea]
MSRIRRFEVVEHFPRYESSIFPFPNAAVLGDPFFPPHSIFEDELHQALGFPRFSKTRPFSFEDFEAVIDLIQIDETPFRSSTRRVTHRFDSGDLYLQALSDRVSALESGFHRLIWEEEEASDRKYTWTAEIKSPEKDRKYKWAAEIKNLPEKNYKLTAEKKLPEKNYKWTAEIKEKRDGGVPLERKYKIEVSEEANSKKKKKKNITEKVKKSSPARIVEIEEPSDHGAVVLRQVFAKRVEKKRGKSRELSEEEAVALIEKAFRAYLIRRSHTLRALRELAIAKNKLKEIRSLFNNFTYRRRLARDAAERQSFSEKIIVLLLTVDAIEGADLMVRGAKRSIVDELEAMLDVIDPQQPAGKYVSRRRTFDMPDAAINNEIAAGVAQVVQLLDQEEATSSGGK